MCRTKNKREKLGPPLSVCLCALVALVAILSTSRATAQTSSPCQAGLTGSCAVDRTRALIGQTITITAVSAGTSANNCDASQVSAYIFKPNGSGGSDAGTLVFDNGTIAGGGHCAQCPDAGICDATRTCVNAPGTYVVSPLDIGKQLTGTIQDPLGANQQFNSAPQPYFVQFLPASAGVVPPGGDQSGLPARGSGSCRTLIITPCLTVTKVCDYPAGQNCFPYGTPIKFRGTVCNTSTQLPTSVDPQQTANDIINIQLTDLIPAGSTPGPITFAGTTSLQNPFDVVTANRLRPGECVEYSGSYTPPGSGTDLCGPFEDTISATGVASNGSTITNLDPCWTTTDGINYTGGQARNPVTASCNVCNNPCVNVTKNCAELPATLTASSSARTFPVMGTVSNCGDVPLQNVTVVDVITLTPANGGAPTTQTITILDNSTLGVATDPNSGPVSRTVTATIEVPANFCGTITDHFRVTANSLCGGAATPDDSESCTITVSCAPQIQVTKSVACAPAGFAGTCGDGLAYGPTANGIVGAAFCYRVTVANTGQDALTGVNITDSTGLTFTPPLPSGNLPVGFTYTGFATATYVNPGSVVNTVTVNSATGASSGINACTADGSVCSASATASLVPISVTCDVALTATGAIRGNGTADIVLPPNASNTKVAVAVTLHNPSTVNLDVAVTIPGRVDCTSGAPVAGPVIVSVPAGGNATTPAGICVLASCPAGLNLNVTAIGTATETDGIPCIYNAQGVAITTAQTSCQATVTCGPQICIIKEIACVETFDPATVCGAYSDTATGVAIGTDNLAHFCYQIRVWNCGPVALNNVVVTDEKLGINFAVGSLPANQTEANATLVPTVPTGWPVGTTINTAIATGVSAVNAADIATAQDSATAIVHEISLSCEKLVSLSEDPATATSTLEIPGDGAAHTVYYFVRVTNTGDLALDVSIDDPACDLENPIVITLPADDPTTDGVDEGVSDIIAVCSRSLTCPLGDEDLTNTITVLGQVHQTEGEPVICDVNGLNQPVTATSTCDVTLTCEVRPCVTRTQGYWFNHVTGAAGCATLQAAITAAGGTFDLGFTQVDLGQALGYFWTKGKNSGPLCHARQKAATQLIAAIANQVLLNNGETGCGEAITDLISRAQTALSGCDVPAINRIQGELDAFNNSGDNLDFPAGLRPCGAGRDQKAFIDANTVAPGATCNAGCP